MILLFKQKYRVEIFCILVWGKFPKEKRDLGEFKKRELFKVFCKNGVLKNLAKDLAGLRPATLSKKRL